MRIPVPLPVRSRERAYGGASEDEIRAAVRAAPKRDVPLSLLRTIQRTVDVDRLAQYESDPHTEPHGGSPIVIERGGKLYLRNGNHRATAEIRRGGSYLRGARVAHLGPSQPMTFRQNGNAGDLLMIDPRAMAVTYRERDVEDVAQMIGETGIACLTIDGPLESKSDGWWCWFDDYESILARFKCAIYSDDVRAVLLKIDSPGGAAAGLNECVDAMLRCKRETGKPVYAYADEGVYSAAYALACVADEIYLPRAGGVGSIGVISQLVDITKMNEKDGIRFEIITSGARKADFNPNVPISGAAIARVQKRVDGLAKIYWALVQDTRGVKAKKLEADTFYGKDAVRKGLADGVMSLEATVGALSASLDRRATSGPSSTRGTLRHSQGRHTMSQVLALTNKVKAATEALSKASRKGKDAAAAALALAEAELSRELAKVTKDKKTVTTTHESESESESSSASSSSSSSSSGSSMSESESESESYESEDKELLSAALAVTGKRSKREAIGALLAMRETNASAATNAARLTALEADRAQAKIDKLIADGKASHKITPGNEAKARKIAAKHGHKALAAFIDAAMPAIDPKVVLEAEDVGGVTLTNEQKKIWLKLGYKEEDFPKLAKKIQKEQERAAKGLPPVRGE